jgi:hypothetical protein
MDSRFSVGEVAYYDDHKGEVLAIRPSTARVGSYNVQVAWSTGVVSWVWESDLLTEQEYDELNGCNGICLSGADLGLPEYGGIAYAHPDCPEHGDPIPEDSDEYVCSPGEAEDLRYVREEDIAS